MISTTLKPSHKKGHAGKWMVCDILIGDEDIAKETLDSIQKGDLIYANDWKQGLRVMAVTENYFVMARRNFGRWDYSVCEKKPWEGIRHNAMRGGRFHIGTDAWIFGWLNWGLKYHCEGYDFSNQEATEAYLQSFDLPYSDKESDGGSRLSERSAVPLDSIRIVRYVEIVRG